MKILLVSINSVYEQTGGGIYLRTLKSLYEMSGAEVDVFSKDSPDYKIRKNIFTDLMGRFLLCPSYIGTYFLKILSVSNKYDVIAFHSTRLGILAKMIKLFKVNKKIICHSDNVESSLIKEININTGILKRILIGVDSILIPYSESYSVKNCEMITFITEEDQKAIQNKMSFNVADKSFIIPVLLNSSNLPSGQHGDYIFFSGSFDFYPNQHALSRIITLAEKNINLKYCVSGRGLNKFISEAKLTIPENLSIFSDVTSTKMAELYQNALLYLCPVKFGSGMKTKIAEALSHNLFVIADKDSTYGYNDAVKKNVVYSVDSNFFESNDTEKLEDLIKVINTTKKNQAKKPYQAFKELYSLEAGIESFRRNIL
ncbi:TPA: glycosyltransferase [Enterobacter chengduensis]|nr:glycosyltransferase [Enterobacter chengduensis]